MKTALIILTVGFVSLAVIIIGVLSIVTSTNRGAEWFQTRTRGTHDEKKPPEDSGG